MARMWSDLSSSSELGWQFFRRDVQARYRESVLGILWAFVPGVVLALGLTLAAQAQLVNISATNIPYPLYVIMGTAIWQVFVDALNAPVAALSSARTVVTKIAFPREALFVSKVGELVFEMLVKTVIILVLSVLFGVTPGSYFWLAPLALIPLIAFGLALGFLLVPFSVLFQDVAKGVGLATPYWFFLTPLVYPIPGTGVLRQAVLYNPVTPFALTVRELLTGEPLTHLLGFSILAPLAMVTMVLAWFIVYVSMPLLIERMST